MFIGEFYTPSHCFYIFQFNGVPLGVNFMHCCKFLHFLVYSNLLITVEDPLIGEVHFQAYPNTSINTLEQITIFIRK